MPGFVKSNFSIVKLMFFLLVFAAGGVVIWKLFAAPARPTTSRVVLPTLEAERMHLHRYTKVFTDPGASGRRAVFIYAGHSTMTGTFRAHARIAGFSVIARSSSTRCAGAHPTMSVLVTRGRAHASRTTVVNSRPYHLYTRSRMNMASGLIHVRITYQTYSRTKKCFSQLYVDAIKFAYKPTFGPASSATAGTNKKESKNKKSKKSKSFAARINTHGVSVESCYFQYGTTMTYGSRVPCQTPPTVSGVYQNITATPTDLTAATYNYRPCVITAAVTVCGSNQTLTAGKKQKKTSTTTTQTQTPSHTQSTTSAGSHDRSTSPPKN